MTLGSYEELRNLHEERRTFGLRAAVAGVICLICSVLLIGRLADLQIIQHSYFSTRSDDNRMRVLPVPPVRGLIYDRNGALLAQNQPAFELEVTPEQVDNLKDTLDRLSKLVHITDTDITRFHDRMRKTPHYRGVVLRSNLSAEEVARYELNRYDFVGVDITAGLVRSYPLGSATAHVIGYVGGITEADYATLDESQYQGLTQIGRTGIERSHEDELRGTPGARIVEANAGGRPLRDLNTRPGQAGENLVLSLDTRLQTIAVQALGELDGAVVAIDPRNGEVLALVSKPGFDPGEFVEGIDNATYQSLLDDPDRPLYNRAMLGTYPPGSTIKPFMALAGLNYNAINPAQRVYCSGTFYLPNSSHKYRCWKRHGHGALDLEEAIAHSCDVYFYTVANTLGVDRIGEMLAQFGYGQATGIDIPNEKAGLLPTRDWKRRMRHEVWYPGETLNLGIGQGYWQVTPMQLAVATARMAMHGAGFKPHLVHAFEDPVTHQTTGVPPQALAAVQTTDPSIYDRVIDGMHAVTQAVGGTAYQVFKDAPYTAAGKTGSAQVAGLAQDEENAPKQESIPLKLRDHALFIAFAPVEDPQIAVAVIAEHGGHGASAAAPIARELMDQWLLGKVLYHGPGAPGATAIPRPAPATPAEPATPADNPVDGDDEAEDTVTDDDSDPDSAR
jgi:penicillin-binding protein 2